MRYFLELAYLGKAYHGWQIQPNAPSVQQTLQRALSLILRAETTVVGAGRTDTGVHASFYVAHFDTQQPIDDAQGFVYHLNQLLPFDIAIRAVRRVRDDAHARFDALEREYEYRITLRKDPFSIDTAYRYTGGPLDVASMNKAAHQLLAYDDFTSFCKLHSNNRTNLCRLVRAEWTLSADRLLFTIAADRFLRNMVRAIVGTLIDVGRGRLTLDGFERIIEGRDRALAGSSAAPEGLSLSGVCYPDDIYV